ncbi:hypothetical protein [uncultured Maricaulis sp.]|uniref:hypothetical protein n=1 Tax=uncultured Maricaulis sp. TaxID=174710 RepID=UPI002617F88B|nr:hypothetical protein [uncultured Maricaulis sp.]
MAKLRQRATSRNHFDLPLFRFAARREDTRRLSYAERFVRSRMPYRPAETVKLYASLAGLNRED